jgi:hypothetical protein
MGCSRTYWPIDGLPTTGAVAPFSTQSRELRLAKGLDASEREFEKNNLGEETCVGLLLPEMPRFRALNLRVIVLLGSTEEM